LNREHQHQVCSRIPPPTNEHDSANILQCIRTRYFLPDKQPKAQGCAQLQYTVPLYNGGNHLRFRSGIIIKSKPSDAIPAIRRSKLEPSCISVRGCGGAGPDRSRALHGGPCGFKRRILDGADVRKIPSAVADLFVRDDYANNGFAVGATNLFRPRLQNQVSKTSAAC